MEECLLIPHLVQNHRSVYYRWTTHVPQGLSAKDTHMARFCDDHARHLGRLDGNERSPDPAAATAASTLTPPL